MPLGAGTDQSNRKGDVKLSYFNHEEFKFLILFYILLLFHKNLLLNPESFKLTMIKLDSVI